MRAKKIILNNYYYYGKEQRKFKCVVPGIELSFFVDYKYRVYQFYNEDMHIDKYKQ